MIKRILVPTDGSEPARLGQDYAIALARRAGAALLGLHVVDVKLLEGPFLRDLSASLGTAPYVNYQGNIASLLEERGHDALNTFRESCAAAGLDCETKQVTGVVSRSIVETGELADLIVMGRGGEHSEWLEGLIGSTTEAVVRRAARPVLVTGTAEFRTERMVLAYDGTHMARHAMRTAAEVAGAWNVALHVLSVGRDEEAADAQAEAREYLQTHCLDVCYATRGGDPGESITAYALEAGADLVIMGAFGHSKVREIVLGSTTSYVLNHTPVPVLLTR